PVGRVHRADDPQVVGQLEGCPAVLQADCLVAVLQEEVQLAEDLGDVAAVYLVDEQDVWHAGVPTGAPQDQSGDKNRLGHITREGAPVVRQLVAEEAWQALRRSPTVRAYFERVQRGDAQRKKIA